MVTIEEKIMSGLRNLLKKNLDICFPHLHLCNLDAT